MQMVSRGRREKKSDFHQKGMKRSETEERLMPVMESDDEKETTESLQFGAFCGPFRKRGRGRGRGGERKKWRKGIGVMDGE